MNPLVLIVGRISAEAKGLRGAPFAAGRRYFEAIVRAGGTPVMLPPITMLVDDLPAVLGRFDAVMLHGGGDVDPRRYGQEPTAAQLYDIVPEHDEVELAVVRAAIERDLPMLAICRGMQVLNVALGGTLHQDIGTESHWFGEHTVRLKSGSRLAKAVGHESPSRCQCVHHQALDRIADDLVVTGHTDDGIVHACELDSARWIVATQWHPEDNAATDAEQQSLFDGLIANC